MKRIVLSAAYGMGNLGDEAICSIAVSDLHALWPDAHITILAWDPDLFQTMHPDYVGRTSISVLPAFFILRHIRHPMRMLRSSRSLLAIVRCDLFVWGGGGLIRNRPYWLRAYLRSFRFAVFCGKRIAVLSVGVDRITDPIVRRMLRVLRHAVAISVRDPHSKEHLLEAVTPLNLVCDVISDGVLRFPSLRHAPVSDPLVVGIALCGRDGLREINEEFTAFGASVARMLRILHGAYPFRLLALPTEPRDRTFNAFVCSLLPDIASQQVRHMTMPEYLAALSTCSLFIGMRMHSLILASRVKGLPFFGFAYSAKVRQLAIHADAERYVFSMAPDEGLVTKTAGGLLSGTIPPPDFSRVSRDSERQRAWLSSLGS